MKKKGFTVIELIVSFSLVTTISIILFQLIFSLKDLYVSGDIKTTLLNRQGIMTKKINDDLDKKTLNGIKSCGVSCLTFMYSEGDVELLVDVAANTITYDNYTMKLTDGSEFGKLSFTYSGNNSNVARNDSLFNLNIPIKSKFFDDDFGIHIVRLYNQSEVAINNTIKLSDATLVANKVPLRLAKTTDTIDVSNFGKAGSEDGIEKARWANIFHQKGTAKFANDNFSNFLKSTDENKKSSLKSLEVFRSTKAIDYLKSKENYEELDNKAKKRMDENYQNGYFEFILDYSGNLSEYNIWVQTSNFTTGKDLTNAITLEAFYNNDNCRWINGLKYNDSKNKKAYVNGCTGDYFAIGATEGNDLLGATGTVNSVDLWVRVDEYLDKYALSKIID